MPRQGNFCANSPRRTRAVVIANGQHTRFRVLCFVLFCFGICWFYVCLNCFVLLLEPLGPVMLFSSPSLGSTAPPPPPAWSGLVTAPRGLYGAKSSSLGELMGYIFEAENKRLCLVDRSEWSGVYTISCPQLQTCSPIIWSGHIILLV